MNTSILDNKLRFALDPPTTITIEASNKFFESLIEEVLASLVTSFKHFNFYKTNNPKQSCNPHPLVFSSFPLPMHVESDCPLSMLMVDNHFACYEISFCLLSPKKILPSSYPHK
jgi:hypothetical protein